MRTLEAFLAWEKRQAVLGREVIMGYRYKNRRKGFKVPDFVVVLAFLALIGSLVWVFRRTILP